MPEMRFVVRWPDQRKSTCYSPSLVVKDYLAVGQTYPLSDFMRRCREALKIASDRVYKKYGFHCTATASQLEQIEMIASSYSADESAGVTVVEFQ